MIASESGEMYMTSDNAYFVMNLKNGIPINRQPVKESVKETEKK